MLAQSEPSASPSSGAPSIAPGTLLAERYRVDAVIGEGGMGVVYLAEHIHIRKRLAIKVLLPQWTRTPEVVARFEQEAVAAGAISHPNVASATDFGRLADGSFFLALEYLEGSTLRAEIEAGPLPPARALAIARGIALGIGAAHVKGIVHRDLKPENVMLVTRDGDPDFVKVLDFGIARVEHRSAQGGALTSAGAVLGTPHYMAPEQALGAQVDGRADLYALGVILFEMLTGECPFRGSGVTLVQQHLLAPPPPLPPPVAERAPPGVQAVLARLLEKEPAARYANAAEVAAALSACMEATTPPRSSRVVVVSGAAHKVARATQWMATVALGRVHRAARFAAWARAKAPLVVARAHAAAALAAALWQRSPRAVLAAGGALGALIVVLTVVALSAGRSPEPPARAARSHAIATPAAASAATPEEKAAPANDAILSCLEGRFADHVENGQPVGDAKGIADARKAIYWVDFANQGSPTRVTLVWTLDGKEVQRQTLSVGHAPHWRTWGAHATRGAHAIEVQVLDAEGRSLKEDSITVDG